VSIGAICGVLIAALLPLPAQPVATQVSEEAAS